MMDYTKKQSTYRILLNITLLYVIQKCTKLYFFFLFHYNNNNNNKKKDCIFFFFFFFFFFFSNIACNNIVDIYIYIYNFFLI